MCHFQCVIYYVSSHYDSFYSEVYFHQKRVFYIFHAKTLFLVSITSHFFTTGPNYSYIIVILLYQYFTQNLILLHDEVRLYPNSVSHIFLASHSLSFHYKNKLYMRLCTYLFFHLYLLMVGTKKQSNVIGRYFTSFQC